MINKVTELRPVNLPTIEEVQAHLDEQNTAGWSLVVVENLRGWYRFFWEKESA